MLEIYILLLLLPSNIMPFHIVVLNSTNFSCNKDKDHFTGNHFSLLLYTGLGPAMQTYDQLHWQS